MLSRWRRFAISTETCFVGNKDSKYADVKITLKGFPEKKHLFSVCEIYEGARLD